MILSSQHKEEPKLWRFWDCGTLEGSLIVGWFDGLSEEARDKLYNLLKNNAKIENPIHWGGFKYMQGALKAQKIWQLSCHDAAGQVRMLGIFSKTRKEAIILMGCSHKDSVYEPRDALEIAIKRAKDFRNGKMKIYERQVITNI